MINEFKTALDIAKASFVGLQMKAGFWFGYSQGSMTFVIAGLQLIQAWMVMHWQPKYEQVMEEDP